MSTLVWVKIETNKAADDIWTFKGQMREEVFNAIISNQRTEGYFELLNTYWTAYEYDDNGNNLGEQIYEYGTTGRLKPYKGNCFLRVEHLVSITPLDGDMDKSRFKKHKRPKGVVTPIHG